MRRFVADEIAEIAEFFSFGTNDLTQMTFGFSRDDIEGRFMSKYLELKLLDANPFETLDVEGVGAMVRTAVELGRKARPGLKIGICGEHGGDPASVRVLPRGRPRLRVVLAVPGAAGPAGGRPRCARHRWPRHHGVAVTPRRYPRTMATHPELETSVPDGLDLADLGPVEAIDVAWAHEALGAYVGGRLRSREEREAELAASLAPGATRPVGAGNRARAEAPDPYRLCFERDLDRVKHSRPWRRLAGKCQVFIAPEDDHLRTRLTHAVEVAQVAVGIARAANLCLPLTEAIALAHDCGHGPAGHASEEAFSPYLPGTGYDHAVYGADVTLAELNLCAETLDGVRNHSWRRPAPATPEGEVVAWADRIAYVCHDFEDAVRAGILEPERPARRGARHRRVPQLRAGRGVRARRARGDRPHRHVGMTEPAASALAAFRAFNFERIYLRPAARRQAERVVHLLRGLVDHFADAPRRLPDPDAHTVVPGSDAAAALAVRYVSGMTDRFALGLGVELLGWRPEDLPRGV